MKPRAWENSNLNEEDYKPKFKTVEAGEQYVYIENVEYEEIQLENGNKSKKFIFEMKSLIEEDAPTFRIYQNLTKKDGSINYFGLKWLNAIGYACSGFHTVLQADEMIGCVVLVTVTLEPRYQDKEKWEKDMATKGISDIPTYPVINPDTILPVSKEIVDDYSTHVDEDGAQDQFYLE